MDLRYVLAGQLRREYLLPPSGQPLIDVPGGNLLYCGAGLSVWDEGIGLLARVGEDYPREWLNMLARSGFILDGVRVMPGSLDVRSFQAFVDLETSVRTNPVSHFARLGLPYPKSLLGYQSPVGGPDDRKQADRTSPHLVDVPKSYAEVKAAHLCPLDFLTHSVFTTEFRRHQPVAVTLDPSPGYMVPAYWLEIRSLLQGVTAFLPSEEDVRSLFLNRLTDLWEMAEALASLGCEIIVIKRGAGGQLLYDARSQNRWEIPAYPSRMVDPTGAGDALCGGFLAGFLKTYDPLQALLHGNVSASLAVEGSGALYALESLPGLAAARLETLSEMVRKV